ncbi:MAG: SDR family oxidoreductase [Pseudomonadota bacterium]
MVDWANKTVAITGASRGIGEAAARYFAEKGARVVLSARSTERVKAIADEITAAGGTAYAVGCDVASFEEVKSFLDTATERFGRLDVLINNAGVLEPIARLADSDPKAWAEVVDINLKGVYYGLRCAIPKMLETGGGTIINISSGAAVSALEGWSQYCSTKAAVLSLTRCVHKEYGDAGIRVVGLSPGTVATEMQVAIKASGINPVSQLDPSVHIPPLWVAQAMEYLCTEASDAHLGADFSLRTEEARRAVGLPAPT